VGGLVCPFRADRDRDYDGDEDGGHSLSVPLRAFPTFDEDRDDDGDEDGGGIACLSPRARSLVCPLAWCGDWSAQGLVDAC
jgi:hypothetical protein